MSMKTSFHGERITIGKIVGVHGVKGTMLIAPLTDFPDRFIGMKELDIQMPGKQIRTFKVRSLSLYQGKNLFRVNLEDVDDRNTAEMFRESIISVSKDERVSLETDEYWIDDIIGLTVFDNESGEELGIIDDVMTTGSNDVYLVKTPEGAIKPLPAIGDVILSIDIEAGNVKVIVPEGLWN